MDSTQYPAPLYPPLINKPLNLEQSDEIAYLVNLKQTFRNAMKDSPYYVVNKETEKSNFNYQIERYSDKYSKQKHEGKSWEPDWNILPKELKYYYCKKSNKTKKRVVAARKKRVPDKQTVDDNVLRSELEVENEEADEEEKEEENDEEKAEKAKSKDDEEKKSDKEGSESEVGEESEDEMEEENDYIDSYFDNGENYDDDEGGDDDGGTY